jgi:hypothetical protein
MAEYTGEVIYEQAPKVKTKPTVNPALVNALVPPAVAPAPVAATPGIVLSPQDQRSFALSEANRKAAEALKLAEEKRKEENPQSSITEGERKASTLLTRMLTSHEQLKNVLKENPNAAIPNYLPGVVQPISTIAANKLNSTDRQRIENAQKDIVDAALTASTGAAYSPQQFKDFKEFLFPQIGDDPATIKDKQDRLIANIEAVRLQAGRAAKLVPEVNLGGKAPAGAPADAKQAPDKNWYSPDPKRPGKYLMWKAE